jgi:hypothetical protein
MNPLYDPEATLTRRQAVLQPLTVAVRTHLSEEMPALAHSVTLGQWYDDIAMKMVLSLKAKVLAEQMPPQTFERTFRIRHSRNEYESWWDHFKDTYQHRWWMRWRKWNVRMRKVAEVTSHVVSVAVQDFWTYPQARATLPERYYGKPVLVSEITGSIKRVDE